MLSSISTLLLLPAAISAATFDCKHIRADEIDFNFEALSGPKSVHLVKRTPPSISNTTFTIDICKPLEKPKDKEAAKHFCTSGTRVCAVETDYNPADDVTFYREIIPIAGEYAASEGRHLDPKYTRLKDSASNSDSEVEGLRVELNGGMYEKVKQKAIVEFLCDHDLEGTEGFDDDSEAMSFDAYGRMGEREDDGDNKEEPLPDLDEGKALQFVSYKEEKDVKVLRLNWKTRFACEGEAGKAPPAKKSSGWGFFTWFIIIVFLLVATYIIFGSWLNYNRYGARGWDLIPHGDTIRDIPYIIKDWTTSVKNSGNRGGYSAV